MRRLALALLLTAVLLPVARPAADAAPARFFASPVGDVEVPAAAVSSGEEPMILVAPDGTLVVGDTSGVHRSLDGGATWLHSSHPFLPGLFTDGRALAYDDQGRLYAAHTQGQVIGVAVSTNHGATWDYTTSVVAAASIADRPWLGANGDGKVALLWYGDIGEECAYSSDAGKTWLTRSLTNSGSPNAGNAILDDQGSVWYSEGSRVTRWTTPCGGNRLSAALPASGAQIFTQLAVTDAGDAFVAQPSAGNGQMQLRGMHGVNALSLKTVVVSSPTLQSNTFGAIAAKPDGSEIAVAWYGSTTAGNPSGAFSGSWNVYVARVAGFWTATPTVTVTQVTTTPNHVGGFCMSGIACTTGDRDLLDYFGVAYDAAGNVQVAYGHDGSTTNAVVRHAQV